MCTLDFVAVSLHDALPIYAVGHQVVRREEVTAPVLRQEARPERGELRQRRRAGGAPDVRQPVGAQREPVATGDADRDRKSTRLNSSHTVISYAVFCLKKKK